MNTLQTKSHSYNQAIKYTERVKSLTVQEAKDYINGTEDTIKYMSEASLISEVMLAEEKAGCFYNKNIATELLKLLDIPNTEHTQDRAEKLVYHSKEHKREVDLMLHYQTMAQTGYKPIVDSTETDNNKKAHIVGRSEGYLGNIIVDLKGTIVNDGKYLGYQKPRQRSKYIPVGFNDVFYKLIKN